MVRSRACAGSNPFAFFSPASTAFPDDNNPIDSFIVGLISLAVALPVTFFLQSTYELSNEVKVPDLWLSWPGGWETKVMGSEGHKDWHYGKGGVQPRRIVRWYARFSTQGEPFMMTLLNLWRRFYAWTRGMPPPWEQDEAVFGARSSTAAYSLDRMTGDEDAGASGTRDAAHAVRTARAVQFARKDTVVRHRLVAVGVIGVLLTWAIFAWFIFTCALFPRAARATACMRLPATHVR